ncbi:hypothetical protein ACFLRC_00970 [Candidatus Altiarchaeota archaeon]
MEATNHTQLAILLFLFFLVSYLTLPFIQEDLGIVGRSYDAISEGDGSVKTLAMIVFTSLIIGGLLAWFVSHKESG